MLASSLIHHALDEVAVVDLGTAPQLWGLDIEPQLAEAVRGTVAAAASNVVAAKVLDDTSNLVLG